MAISKEDAMRILVEARKKKVQQQIDESTERAATVMHEVLNSEDTPPVVRVAAAKDILDRGGFKPVERQVVTHILPKPILDLDAMISEPEVLTPIEAPKD